MKDQLISFWLKLLVICFVFLVFLRKAVVLLWWRPRKIEEHFSRQGIRGPPYRFFIGNVKELGVMMLNASSQPMPFSHNILPRVLSFYHHWKRIYGETFLVWFGPTVRLTISDPNLIKDIFTSNSGLYEKIEAHPLVKQLEGDGLLNLKGPKWAHHRKIITPTFHMENLKLLIPELAKSMVDMLDKWVAMSDSYGEVEIEVSEWFQTLAEDVITRTAFGCSYEDGKAIFRLQAQQMELVADGYEKVFIPGYRFLPTKRNITSWKLDKEIKKSVMKLIERRKYKNYNSHDDGDLLMQEKTPKDLLGLMIQASESCPSSRIITVHDIVEEIKGFFFAGKQTTSNFLTWTTVLLAMHPHWQVQAREEVLRVCGTRDVPNKDDVVKLKMLSMILNESLRLYPPAIATIRRAKADVDLGGYKVPCGTEILVPILAVHHDQAVWGNDANEFNPGRFSDGGGASRGAKHPTAFIPFGHGVRMCIGQNLAMLQTKLAVSMILQRFSFRLAPTYRHAPTVLMILCPQYGAPVLFQSLPHYVGPKLNQGF